MLARANAGQVRRRRIEDSCYDVIAVKRCDAKKLFVRRESHKTGTHSGCQIMLTPAEEMGLSGMSLAGRVPLSVSHA